MWLPNTHIRTHTHKHTHTPKTPIVTTATTLIRKINIEEEHMARWRATDVAHTTDDTQHRQTGGVDARDDLCGEEQVTVCLKRNVRLPYKGTISLIL